jgi:hypothetical protein
MSLVMLLAIGDFEGVIAALSRSTMMSWNPREILHDHRVACMDCGCQMLWTFDCHGHERPASGIAFDRHDFVIERE